MVTQSTLQSLVEIPKREIALFKNMVQEYRKKYIRRSSDIVAGVFEKNKDFAGKLKNKEATEVILTAREAVWQEFLVEESHFNTEILKDLGKILPTPKSIIESLIEIRIANKSDSELVNAIKDICGEYAGRVYPYIYDLSLSNTQSRRSRSGSTFQDVMYKVYELLDYPFDSQSKVGKSVFTNAGLGKIVDSILPGIESFTQRRDKTIIGTMKTSLRERWQEVSEEIQRTNVPAIYLLTVDTDISSNKAKQMSEHNIIVVAPKTMSDSDKYGQMRNIISFEEYLFQEIPNMLSYWK